jgi:hypothetical protein
VYLGPVVCPRAPTDWHWVKKDLKWNWNWHLPKVLGWSANRFCLFFSQPMGQTSGSTGLRSSVSRGSETRGFVFSIVFFLSLHNEKKIPSRVFVFFCLQCKGMGTGRPESNPPRRLHFRTTPIEKVRVGWLPVPLTSASDTGCQRFGSEPSNPIIKVQFVLLTQLMKRIHFNFLAIIDYCGLHFTIWGIFHFGKISHFSNKFIITILKYISSGVIVEELFQLILFIFTSFLFDWLWRHHQHSTRPSININSLPRLCNKCTLNTT